MILKYVLPLLAVLMLGFAVVHVVRSQEDNASALPPLPPAEAPYEENLAATGIVEASTTNIAVASPVQGILARLFVRAGQRVAVNEALFALDDRPLRAERRVRETRLATARAELDRLRHLPRAEELPSSAARIREAQAMLHERTLHHDRAKEQFKKNLIGEDEWERSQAMMVAAREQLARAEADDRLLKAGASATDQAIARARIAEAEALVEQVQTDLERLTVRAPVAGTILQVNVRVGEAVGARPESPILLGETQPLHLRVDLDEQQIARFRPDAPASAVRRGAPQPLFSLRFVRVEPLVMVKRALTGDVSERSDSRVLQVIYELNARQERLYVGQQMDVFIATTSR
ncbi:MAG TPA: biotin/lipoyl-binding protein [Gemmataceae bacterium]|nr:biotin/lipoyl-binding protein [Gemmataceae bacterium]